VADISNIDDARRQREAEASANGFTDTDIANGRRLAEQHGADLHFTPERGWLVWDGRRWAADEKDVAVQARAKSTAVAIFDEVKGSADRDALFKHAKRSQQKRAVEAMIWLARSEPGIPTRLTVFDADPWLLNVANGTLDLRTGALRAHRREDLLTRLVDVAYDPQAECVLWETFLKRVTGSGGELYKYLQRFVGYLLTGLTSEQVLHFLYGLGNNGKTVFCEIIEALLGDYAIVVSPELVMVRRHSSIPNDIARLRGVRMAVMNETSQGSRFDEAKLKDLTGSDSLTGRFLHAEFFDFIPTHKLVIRGNHKPVINGTDEGIWRRLCLVPFGVTITEAERDRELILKLRQELPGILRWAVDGCTQWHHGGLKPPTSITDAVRDYRAESDTLGRFIDEHCEVSKQAQVKSGTLFSAYQKFCEHGGERWLSSKDLPAEMQRRGFDWKRTTGGCLYYGIALAAASEPHWSDR
jgi:putative DNA primase/helicase